jgi:hypothetical protein
MSNLNQVNITGLYESLRNKTGELVDYKAKRKFKYRKIDTKIKI